MITKNRRVLVGLSGGIDSLAAVLKLRQNGYLPIGCTIILNKEQQNIEKAVQLANSLQIEHVIVDATSEFNT